MQVNGICRKEFISVLNGLIASPVELEHFAVGIKHGAANSPEILVLHHCPHDLRKECRVIVVEQMQPHAQCLSKMMQIIAIQVLIGFYRFGVSEFISSEHLSDKLLSNWLVAFFDFCVNF